MKKITLIKSDKLLNYLTFKDKAEYLIGEPKSMARYLIIKDEGEYLLIDGITGDIIDKFDTIDDIMDYVNVSPKGLVVFHGINYADVPSGKFNSDFVYFFVDEGKFVNLDLHNTFSAESVEGRLSLSQLPTPPAGYIMEGTGINSDMIYVDPNGRYTPAPHTHPRSEITDFWSSPFWDNIPDKPSEFPPESHTHDWNEILNKPSTYPPDPHTHPRSEITDFFDTPFWGNIPDKPSTFPPEAHTHTKSEITDWDVPYSLGELNDVTISSPAASHFLRYDGSKWVNEYVDWLDIKNKPATYPPSSHTHSRSEVTDFFDSPFWSAIPDKPFESFDAVPASIIPSADNTYDLGSSTYKWRDAYFTGSVTASTFKGNIDWSYIQNTPSTYPPESHTHSRSDITDFFDSPFWDNIPDKPSTYPPSSHTHSRSDITDFFDSPFWDNIPDKPSTFPPSSHTHNVSDIAFNNSVIPSSDNTYDLGSSSLRWRNIYHSGSLNFLNRVWAKFKQGSYGHGVYIGAGGVTVIGGGESADQGYNNVSVDDETLYLLSDGNVTVISNLQNGWDNRIQNAIFKTDGTTNLRTILPLSDNAYDLGSSSKRWKNGYFAGDLWIYDLHLRQDDTKIVGGGHLVLWASGIEYFRCRGTENVIESLSIKPKTDNTYDLGSSSYRWKDGYFAGTIRTNNVIADATSSEARLEFDTGLSAYVGFFGRSTDGAFGTYDWANGQSIWYYYPSSKTITFFCTTTFSTSPLPNGDKSFNFGSSTKRWKTGHFADTHPLYLYGTSSTEGNSPVITFKEDGSTSYWILGKRGSEYSGQEDAFLLSYYDGSSWHQYITAKAASDVLELRGTIKSFGTIIPSSNNTYDIGSSSYKWKDGHFAGYLYATRVNAIWEDPDNDVSIAADNDTYIHVKNKARSSYKGIAVYKLYLNGAVLRGSSSAVYPQLNNTYDFGSSSYKWKNGYFAGQLITGGAAVSVKHITSDYSATDNDFYIIADEDGLTVTLPSAGSVPVGKMYLLTCNTAGGSAGLTVSHNGNTHIINIGESYIFISDGTQYIGLAIAYDTFPI